MIYFDNNSTTPIHPLVLEAMMPYLVQNFGNASSLHSLGMDAKTAVDNSRRMIAEAIGAKPKQIVFTSGATEANNLAILGSALASQNKNHIIVSAVDHESVIDTAKRLERDGYRLTILNVDKYGFVDSNDLKDAVSEETFIVSIAIANHEIGTIQNIRGLSDIAHTKGSLFHTDAAQAFGKIPFNVKDTGVDLATFSAHKMHGPKGVGVLYAGRNARPRNIMEGKAQESGIRPGTQNVPAIIGFGKAVETAIHDLDQVYRIVRPMQQRLFDGLSEIEFSTWNGPDVKERLLGNINITFDYIEGEAIMMHLSNRGIYVSTGSSCISNSGDPSTVLSAIGLSPEQANGTIRLSLSRFNTMDEVDNVISNVSQVVEMLRAMTPGIPNNQ